MKIFDVSLADFVKKFPQFRSSFSNLLKDPNYRVRYSLGKENNLYMIEVCYADDFIILK